MANASGAQDIARATTGQSPDMPSAVEDYGYPNAEKILTEQHLTLKRGNGNILLAECGSDPDLMKFVSRDREDFCFRVNGKKGYLSLEAPAVTGVQTKDYSAKIDMTVGDEHSSYDVGKNKWQGIGETTDPEARDHTLVEIVTDR